MAQSPEFGPAPDDLDIDTNTDTTSASDDYTIPEPPPYGAEANTLRYTDFEEMPSDLKTPGDVLDWFAWDDYCMDFRPELRMILGEQLSEEDIEGIVTREIRDRMAVGDFEEEAFLKMSELAVKLGYDEKGRLADIAKETAISLLFQSPRYLSSQRGNRYVQNEVVRLIDLADKANYDDEHLQAEANRAIDAGLKSVIECLGDEDTPDPRTSSDFWELALKDGTYVQRQWATERLSRLEPETEEGKGKRLQSVDDLCYLLRTTKDPNVRGSALEISEKFFIKELHFNLEQFNELWRSWTLSGPESGRDVLVATNLADIFNLEYHHPGIAKGLYENFGIRTFARYPDSMLTDLYEHMDKGFENFGILLRARNDWNGAFAEPYVISKFYRQIQDAGNWGIVILEAADAREAISRLNDTRGRFGSAWFSIIDGHGTEDSIQFGSHDDYRGILTIRDIEKMIAISNSFETNRMSTGNPIALKKAPLLKPGSTILLNSCSTGSEKGIGQKISRLIRGQVLAPSIPAGIENLEFERPKKPGEVPKFKVKYNKEGIAREYNLGLTWQRK